MNVLNRLFQFFVGLLCSFIGFISLLVSISMMFVHYSDIEGTSAKITMVIFKFIICEILLAFGVTAFLVGLKFVFNRKDWFKSIIDKYWSKSIKIAMAIPFIGFAISAVINAIELFS